MWKALFLLLCVPLVAFANSGPSEDLSPVEVFNLPNTHAGREFVVTFPPCIQLPFDDTVSFALEMFGFEEQVVTVESERNGYSETRIIAPFTIVRWELPQEVAQVYQHMSDADIRADAVYENAAINVRTNKKLALTVSTTVGSRFAEYQAIPRESAWETHTALVLPEDSLAREHDTLRLPSHIAITGLEDNTEVRVLVFGDSTCLTNGGAEYGDTITRTINRGDVFLVSSGGRNANLQGTHIQSSIPVGVTISSYKSFTDEFGTYCDIGMEQVYSHEVNPGVFSSRVSALPNDSVTVVVASTNYLVVGNPLGDLIVHDSTVALKAYKGEDWESFVCNFDWYSTGLEQVIQSADNSRKSLSLKSANGWSRRARPRHLIYTGEARETDSVDYRLIISFPVEPSFFQYSLSGSTSGQFNVLTSSAAIVKGVNIDANGYTEISLRLPCNSFVQFKRNGDESRHYSSSLHRKLSQQTSHIRTSEIVQFDLPYDGITDAHFDVKKEVSEGFVEVQVSGNPYGVSDYVLECENCHIEQPQLHLSPRQYNIIATQDNPDLPFRIRGYVFDRCIYNPRIDEIGDNCYLRVDDPNELATSFGDTVYFQIDLHNSSSQFAHIDSIWFSGDPAGFGFVDVSQLQPQTLAPGETYKLDLYFLGSEHFLDTTYLDVATNCYGGKMRERLLGRTFNSPERDCALGVVDSLECVRDSLGRSYNRIVVRNLGVHPIRIDSIRLNSSTGALTLEQIGSNDSIVIFANETVHREIRVDRNAKEEVRDTLHVYYDCGTGYKGVVLYGDRVVSNVSPDEFVSIHAEVIPNPVGVDARLFIEAAGHRRAEVQFVNMLGEIYATKNVDLSTTRHVSIPSDLTQGVWFAVVRVGPTVVTVPFVR